MNVDRRNVITEQLCDLYIFQRVKLINARSREAIPVGIQAKTDKKCGTLILNHIGEKSVSKGNAIYCWP